MADPKLKQLPTSAANFNCLIHSLIPHLIRNDRLLNRVAQDQALRDELQNYWQLDKAITPDDVKYLFRKCFTARQDQEMIIGPVLRRFLYKQMQAAFEQWKQEHGRSDFYCNEIEGDSNDRHFNQGFPAFLRGFVDAYMSRELRQQNIDSFSQYLNNVVDNNQFLDGRDISILQERWHFYWDYTNKINMTTQAHINSQLTRLANNVGYAKLDLEQYEEQANSYGLDSQTINEIKDDIQSLKTSIERLKNQSINDEQLQLMKTGIDRVAYLCHQLPKGSPLTQSRMDSLYSQLNCLYNMRAHDEQTLNDQEESLNIQRKMEAAKEDPDAQNKDVTIHSYYTGYNHYECLVPQDYIDYYEQQSSRLVDTNHNNPDYNEIRNSINHQLNNNNSQAAYANTAEDVLCNNGNTRVQYQYQKLYEQWQEWQNDPDKQAILEAEDHKAASKNLPRDYQPSQFIGHFFRCNNLNEQQDNILYEDGKGCKASANEQDANYSEDYKLALQLQEEEIEQFFETTQAETDYSKTPG